MSTVVVSGIVRNRGDVLVLCEDAEPSTANTLWQFVTTRTPTDPVAGARAQIETDLGVDPSTLSHVRTGPRVDAEPDMGADRAMVAVLFDIETRSLSPASHVADWEWITPTALRDRETSPWLWDRYDEIRPTVETIASDTTHGSAWLSYRALECVRDEAAQTSEPASETENGTDPVSDTVHDLLAARPAMTALANRIHRVMADARTPAEQSAAAQVELVRAQQADRDAATTAASTIGNRVATLSRSGTVLEALEQAPPDELIVAESRPGREGVSVAEALADTTSVTLVSDLALASELTSVDTLIVGADTILPDGRLINKVGTRAAAVTAAYHDVDVIVGASIDKISPDSTWDSEERDRSELYEGDHAISLVNPTFDLTPAALIDWIGTERGTLETGDVAAIADSHRTRRAWVEDTHSR